MGIDGIAVHVGVSHSRNLDQHLAAWQLVPVGVEVLPSPIHQRLRLCQLRQRSLVALAGTGLDAEKIIAGVWGLDAAPGVMALMAATLGRIP